MASPLCVSPHHRGELGLANGLTAADVNEDAEPLEELLDMGLEGRHRALPPRPSFSCRRLLDHEHSAQWIGLLNDIQQKAVGIAELLRAARVVWKAPTDGLDIAAVP